MTDRPTQARVEYDPARMGVRIAVARGRQRQVLTWTDPGVFTPEGDGPTPAEAERPDLWLNLQEDDARAIYEALGDYFGQTGNDTRALRRDYDAERKRVDKALDALIAQAGRSLAAEVDARLKASGHL